MNEQLIDINELHQDDHNFNKGTAEGQKLMEKSFKELGAGRSILVDREGNIIAGNKSQKAAIAAGIQKVRVIETDGTELIAVKRTDLDLNSAEGRKLALADNLTTQVNLAWDEVELQNVQTELEDFDAGDWGYELQDVESEDEKEAKEDDFDAEAADIPQRVSAGEVWLLGEHRLMCGDSTKAESYVTLLEGEKAQMTFSDPPYNVDYQGQMSSTTKNGVIQHFTTECSKYDDIKNDKMTKEEFRVFILKVLRNLKENVKGAWYLSFSAMTLEELLMPLREVDMNWKSIIVWMKNQASMSMKDFKSRYEPIVYGRFDNTYYGKRGSEEDIWEYQRTLKNDLHPTMKPIPLIENMVKMSSKEGDIVLDVFGGSGSTLIACEQLGRKCRMMELDPHYCDVILARWEKLTGKTAVKL